MTLLFTASLRQQADAEAVPRIRIFLINNDGLGSHPVGDDRKRPHAGAAHMRPYAPSSRTITLFVAGLVMAPALQVIHAQDMTPPIDAVGAYNHANVMTRPHAQGEYETSSSAAQTPRDIANGSKISRQEFDTIVASLRSEYQKRVARDGQAEADTWLRSSVARLKQRYTTIED